MKKRLITGITAVVSALLLVGCVPKVENANRVTDSESYPEWDNTEMYLESFGENSDSSDYFCYAKKVDHADRIIVAYNISTKETKDVFTVTDTDEEWIRSYRRIGDKAYITVDDGESSRYYECDLSDGDLAELSAYPFLDEGDGQSAIAKIDTSSYGKVAFKRNFDEPQYLVSVDGNDFTSIEELDDKSFSKSGIFSKNLTYADGKIYGVITAVESGHIITDLSNLNANNLLGDHLFSYDPSTGECSRLYSTHNGYTRIVGYSDGYVYIYKNGNLSKLDLSDNSTQNIADFDAANVTIGCIGRKMIVFDQDKNEVIDSIDM